MTTPDCTDPPLGDDLDRSVDGMLRARRVVIGVLATAFLALPAVAVFRQQGLGGDAAFLVPGTVLFIVLVDRWVLVRVPVPAHRPLRDEAVLWVIVVLGVALFVAGQMNWLTALAIAAAGAGRFAASLPRAVIGVAACAAAGWRSACGTTSATAPRWRRSGCRCWAASSPTARSGATS